MRVSLVPVVWLMSLTASTVAKPPDVKLDMKAFETALADYFVDQKADSLATLEAKLGEKTITFCKNVYGIDPCLADAMNANNVYCSDSRAPCMDWKFTPQEYMAMQMPPPVPGLSTFPQWQ